MSALILDYEKPRPWWRHRRTRRRILLASAIVLIFYTGPSNIIAAAKQAWLLYWQGRCLAHPAPGDSLVFTSPVAEAPRSPSPRCWDAYTSLLTSSLGGTNGCGSAGTPLFLHARDNTEGEERLVAVELTSAVEVRGVWELSLRTRVVAPGTWREPPVDSGWEAAVVRLPRSREGAGPLRVYPGEASAKDQSLISIRCEAGRSSSVIRASMCGDYLAFEDPRPMDGDDVAKSH